LVANGGKAEVQTHVRNDAIDPERQFAIAICRIAKRSFDHLVGEYKEVRRDIESERLGGFEVDDKLEFGRLYHRQFAGLLASAAQPAAPQTT
jgi:hypothetical protein